MEDKLYLELKSQLEAQGKALEEVRKTQMKIADALLGSFDRNSVGLIEEQRIMKRDVNMAKLTIEDHSTKINDLLTFRAEVKRVVALIAFSIPFAFELIKGLVGFLWEYLKGGR